MFNIYYFVCLAAVLLVKLQLCDADGHKIIFRDDDHAKPRPPQPRPTITKFKDGDDDDPCAPYNPRTPDFSRPGRRVSSVKCYEYIWQMRARAENVTRKKKCVQRQDRPPDGFLQPSLYVIGGFKSQRGEFPNMGAIGWKAVVGSWVFMCGSSLISPKFVLTAAHCSSASSYDTTIVDVVPKIVRLGQRSIMDSSYTNGEKPHDAKIIRIINHPNYKPPKKYFDIALMELGTDVKFSSDIQPVCLWGDRDIMKYGKQAEIAGWGVVRSGSTNMSPELLAATVDIVEPKKCDELLANNCNRNWCGLKDQICAGKLAGGVDSCQGDSGGPLQVKIPLPIDGQGSMHYLLGVTSFGIGCGLPNMPGVYTSVSSFIDWIEPIVWKK